MRRRLEIALLCGVALNASAAAPQPRRYIISASGAKCWYAQRTVQETHFHTIPGPISTLVFSDQRCMVATGLDAEVNARMINVAVSHWHSHSDADFAVNIADLYRSSTLQVRGRCIQSRKYPSIGIAIEYFARDGYLSGVKHADTVGGCSR